MKIALSKKEICVLVYKNYHSELGFDTIQFELDLRRLFRG